MEKPHGIIVFGASGSGCTTLGRELARILNFELFDTDDLFFEPTDPPYTKARPLHERQRLLSSAIKVPFIISGCLREWGGFFDDVLSLAVFIKTPTNVRLERLDKREYAKNGERIRKGGDLYERHKWFMEYVSTYDNGGMETRSLASQKAWANSLSCPVLQVDGTTDWRVNAENVKEQFLKRSLK